MIKELGKAPQAKRRITTLTVAGLLLGAVIIGRAGWIQVLGDARLQQLAERQFQAKVLVRARRGLILDRNGEPLAVNVESLSVAANPMKVKDAPLLAKRLARHLGGSHEKIRKKLESKKEFVWIKRHVPESVITNLGKVPDSVWIVKESRRAYPHGKMAAQVIGAVDTDTKGLEGVELWKNDELKGEEISVQGEKDALGRPTFLDPQAASHVTDGEPVTLTLDAQLQFAIEQSLAESIIKTGSRAGTVIVMNATSGEILGMANQPSFDPNVKGAPAAFKRNRAVTDAYEPGSTVKPLLMAAALAHKMSPSSQVWGGLGKMKLQGKTISEAESHEKFKWLSLEKMVAVSSNVGASRFALKLGAKNYLSFLRSLGLGARTGTGFPGELALSLPSPQKVIPLHLANMGFGQGLLVTPLQMTRAYAAIVNGGWLVEPTLLRSQTSTAQALPPRRVFSEKIATRVLHALTRATSDLGTGYEARLDGYKVAGKTGTAQVVDPKTKRYSQTHYITSFIGFPLEVEPKLVIYTTLDGPKSNYYATQTAAPLFRAVLAAVLNRYNVPPKPEYMVQRPEKIEIKPTVSQDELKWSFAQGMNPQQEALLKLMDFQGVKKDGQAIWTMPDLSGLSAREVMKRLKGYHVDLSFKGFGIVVGQSPRAGARLSENARVEVAYGER